MGEFVVYSVKVSLCLVMFYVFYKLLLSRTTLHAFNRFVILSLVAVSLLLPFIHITVSEPVIEGTVTVDQLLMMATVAEGQGAPEFHLSAVSIAVLIYIIGVAGFFINMLLSYLGIHRIMKKASRVVEDDGARIYVVDEDIAPFSWFRNIVISEADYRDHRRAIITHEKAHAARGHSADILLCNVLTVVQWFNPAAWLLKAELQDVHEYEADEAVLSSGIDATGYQLLLVRKAVGDRLFAIANNLSKDSLKKRITMMKTKKTNRWMGMKALVVLPLAAVAVVAFASPEMAEVENKVVCESQQLVQAVEQQVTGQSEVLAIPAEETSVAEKAEEAAMPETAPADTAKSKKVYDVVETMPSFPGGAGEMMKYLAANIKYPKEAEEKNITGRVIVSFVVTATGDITNVNIVKPVHPSLDAEALRIVSGMPKWTPGMQSGKPVNVKFTLPVIFRFSDAGNGKVPAADEKTDGAQLEDIAVIGYGPSEKPHYYGTVKYTDKTAESQTFKNGPDPLIVIDGKEMPDMKSLEGINPQNIEKIDVLKDPKAVQKYGDKGKNGVIVVTTKKK